MQGCNPVFAFVFLLGKKAYYNEFLKWDVYGS